MTRPDLATADLLASTEACPSAQALAAGAVLLRGFAVGESAALLQAVQDVVAAAPWRHMTVPGGGQMSVAMSNCGPLGWTSGPRGYRYRPDDPETGLPWPPMPAPFKALATAAALRAGFTGFRPDACLVNRYAPGARLALHQDRNEADLRHPIVSVSLGLPAEFLFGGLTRREPPPAPGASPRRCRRLGRPQPAALPRRAPLGGRRASGHRALPHQPDFPPRRCLGAVTGAWAIAGGRPAGLRPHRRSSGSSGPAAPAAKNTPNGWPSGSRRGPPPSRPAGGPAA